MLYGIMVRSTIPHARIKSIHYPEMEEGYYTVAAHDMTEPNFLRDEKDGQQIYADEFVNYIGEGIAMICGPKEKQTKRYAEQTVVERASKHQPSGKSAVRPNQRPRFRDPPRSMSSPLLPPAIAPA